MEENSDKSYCGKLTAFGLVVQPDHFYSSGSGSTRRLSSTPRRLQRVRRVGLVPLHVTRRPVDRRDRLVPSQAQPRLHLRPVMAGVQDSSPEDPNPFTLQAAKEGAMFQPPGGGALRQLRQPAFHQPDVFLDVGCHARLLAGRQQFFDGRFLRADELNEEAALGEKLVDQDGADRVESRAA